MAVSSSAEIFRRVLPPPAALRGVFCHSPPYFASPAVPTAKKKAIIRRVFSEPDFSGRMVRFLEKICENGCMDELEEMIQVWRKRIMEDKGILEAELEYVVLPDAEQLAGIKNFLCRRMGKKHVQLELKENPELLDGFILRAGDMEYDCSLRGQLAALTRAVAG